MKKNITIAIDENLAREVRVLAAHKDKSVSQLLADYLESIVEREKKKSSAKRDFFALTQKTFFLNYSRRTFNRDTLHER